MFCCFFLSFPVSVIGQVYFLGRIMEEDGGGGIRLSRPSRDSSDERERGAEGGGGGAGIEEEASSSIMSLRERKAGNCERVFSFFIYKCVHYLGSSPSSSSPSPSL